MHIIVYRSYYKSIQSMQREEHEMRYYQVAYRGNKLSISEEDLSFLPRSANWSENLYTVEGAVESDIQTLNSLEIKGNDIHAVADELTAIWFDLDTTGCVWEEIVDLEEVEVVYNPATRKFLAVSDIETEPVYMYWNDHEFKYVWLPEPEHIVEAGEEPDLTIQGENSRTAVYDISALDGKTAENVSTCENGRKLKRYSQQGGSYPPRSWTS